MIEDRWGGHHQHVIGWQGGDQTPRVCGLEIIHLPGDLPELVGSYQASMHPLCLMLRQHEPASHTGLVTAEEHTVQQGYPSDLSKPMPMGEDNDPGTAGRHGYSTLVAGVISTVAVGTGWRRTTRKSKGKIVNTASKLQLTDKAQSKPKLKIPAWRATIKLPKPMMVGNGAQTTALPALW